MAEARFPIKKGDTGNQVTALQNWMNVQAELIDRPLVKVDGKFGKDTQDALYDLVGIKQVTEKAAQAMLQAGPGMAERLKVKRAGGVTPDRDLRRLVEQDQAIFQRLVRIYTSWNNADAAARQRHAKDYARAFDAAARLMKRFSAMERSKQILIAKGYPAELKPLVQRLMGKNQIAVAPIVIGVVALIALIAGGATTVAVSNWMTPAYKESTVDLKVTKELEAILAKLSPEDRAALTTEVEKQIDQAAETGMKRGAWHGLGTGVKIAGGLVLSAIAWFSFVEPALDKRKARRA